MKCQFAKMSVPQLMLLITLLVISAKSPISAAYAAGDNQAPNEQAVKVEPGESVARLPAEDVPRLEEKALQGSADAALKLARNFLSLGNTNDRIYWLMVGVEDGDSAMRFELATALTQSHEASDKIRARYWYKRIITDGPPDQSALAKQELEAWDEYEKKFQTHYKPD